MNIPGDTGHPWRLKKFIEYQKYAPAIDPLTLGEYAVINNLDSDNCIYLAWLHSMTYCEITAIYLLDKIPIHKLRQLNTTSLEKFWSKYKDKLVFNSSRKYVKNMDWFVPLMVQFLEVAAQDPTNWLYCLANSDSPRNNFQSIEHELNSWKYMGRFSVDLFMEAITTFNNNGLIDLELMGGGYSWKDSSNLTSGLFNIFYHDEKADLFDKKKLVTAGDMRRLDGYLKIVVSAAEAPLETIPVMSVVNKICSWRNLFKGARYGGFHHDRQLENLLFYQENFPEQRDLWDNIFQIRRNLFEPHMLGELGGWRGIRPARKKLWIQKGLTGVEKNVGEY